MVIQCPLWAAGQAWTPAMDPRRIFAAMLWTEPWSAPLLSINISFPQACFKITEDRVKAPRNATGIRSMPVHELVQARHLAGLNRVRQPQPVLLHTLTSSVWNLPFPFKGPLPPLPAGKWNPSWSCRGNPLSMWIEKYQKSHSCITNAYPHRQTKRTQCFSMNHSLLHPGVWLMLLELWSH